MDEMTVFVRDGMWQIWVPNVDTNQEAIVCMESTLGSDWLISIVT